MDCMDRGVNILTERIAKDFFLKSDDMEPFNEFKIITIARCSRKIILSVLCSSITD